MNKIFLLSVFLLFGCSGVVNRVVQQRNPKCENIDRIKIFQVLNDGALASVCESKSFSDCWPGLTVAIPNQVGELFYDDKIIQAPKGKCFVFLDKYTYKTKVDDTKTVPIVSFEYEYPAVTEEEQEIRLVEALVELESNLYNQCLVDSNDQFKKSVKDNERKCKCFSDFMVEKVIGAVEDETKRDAFNWDAVILDAEKKCGKLPDVMKE